MPPVRSYDGRILHRVTVAPGERTCRRCGETVAEVNDALGRAPVVLGTIATMVRDTNEHRQGLAQLSNGDMPALLGSVPQRGGIEAENQLANAYREIATMILRQIGGGA